VHTAVTHSSAYTSSRTETRTRNQNSHSFSRSMHYIQPSQNVQFQKPKLNKHLTAATILQNRPNASPDPRISRSSHAREPNQHLLSSGEEKPRRSVGTPVPHLTTQLQQPQQHINPPERLVRSRTRKLQTTEHRVICPAGHSDLVQSSDLSMPRPISSMTIMKAVQLTLVLLQGSGSLLVSPP
jgi:hypothetical protein